MYWTYMIRVFVCLRYPYSYDTPMIRVLLRAILLIRVLLLIRVHLRFAYDTRMIQYDTRTSIIRVYPYDSRMIRVSPVKDIRERHCIRSSTALYANVLQLTFRKSWMRSGHIPYSRENRNVGDCPYWIVNIDVNGFHWRSISPWAVLLKSLEQTLWL